MNDWQKFENKRYLDAKDLITQATARAVETREIIQKQLAELARIKLEEARKHAAFHAARDENGKL